MSNRENRVRACLHAAGRPLLLEEVVDRTGIAHGRCRVALRALAHAGLAARAYGFRWQSVEAPPGEFASRMNEAWEESKRMRRAPDAKWTQERPA